MVRLLDTHQDVFEKFNRGLYVFRRSDTYWAVIFSDLYSEQGLMGCIKSVRGLTRGRRFDDSTSRVWLLSAPAYDEVFRAIQEITGLPNTVHRD